MEKKEKYAGLQHAERITLMGLPDKFGAYFRAMVKEEAIECVLGENKVVLADIVIYENSEFEYVVGCSMDDARISILVFLDESEVKKNVFTISTSKAYMGVHLTILSKNGYPDLDAGNPKQIAQSAN